MSREENERADRDVDWPTFVEMQQAIREVTE